VVGALCAIVLAAGVAFAVGAATSRPAPTLGSVLSAQSNALLRGDETTFLAPLDPADTTGVTLYRDIFENLRALQVTSFSQFARGDRAGLTRGTRFGVTMAYCLRITVCQQHEITVTITAEPRRGGVRIVAAALPPAGTHRLEPRPWEVALLTVVTGPRVVLAAGPDEAALLPAMLPIAEQAAKVADGYAIGGRPVRYIIYLADTADADTWFGGILAGRSGEAVPISSNDIEAMLVVSARTTPASIGDRLRFVLQHELAHVATLSGALHYTEDSLVEGIAEYIGYAGVPRWRPDVELSAVGAYVTSGRWSGNCYLTSEIGSSDPDVSDAAYGIGYLTIKYFMGRYGPAKTLRFFGLVEREGQTVDAAARAVYRAPWKTVNAGCAAYVRGKAVPSAGAGA
jgi:hypothetical protein